MRTQASAARIRRKHEKTIAEQESDKKRLRRTWSWVLAELTANPDRTDQALDTVTDLARDLNERSIR